MKRLYLVAVAACCALSLAACTTTSGTPWPADPGGPVVSGANTTLDEKALISAELAWNVPAQAYLVAVDRGLLTGTTKDKAKAALMDAFVALKLAREAYRAGNASTLAAQIAIAASATAQAKALIPGS